MTIVKVESEEDLQKLAAKALDILVNLRFHTNYWNEHYGYGAKKNKERWEYEADQFLSELGFTDHINTKAIQIVRE